MSGVTENSGFSLSKTAQWTVAGATVPAAFTGLMLAADRVGGDNYRPMPWSKVGRYALKAGGVGALIAAEINLLRGIALPDSSGGALAAGGATGAVAGAVGGVGIMTILDPKSLRHGRALGAAALGVGAAGYAIGSMSGFLSPDRNMLPF